MNEQQIERLLNALESIAKTLEDIQISQEVISLRKGQEENKKNNENKEILKENCTITRNLYHVFPIFPIFYTFEYKKRTPFRCLFLLQ